MNVIFKDKQTWGWGWGSSCLATGGLGFLCIIKGERQHQAAAPNLFQRPQGGAEMAVPEIPVDSIP